LTTFGCGWTSRSTVTGVVSQAGRADAGAATSVAAMSVAVSVTAQRSGDLMSADLLELVLIGEERRCCVSIPDSRTKALIPLLR
jgi:hypothetical protein